MLMLMLLLVGSFLGVCGWGWGQRQGEWKGRRLTCCGVGFIVGLVCCGGAEEEEGADGCEEGSCEMHFWRCLLLVAIHLRKECRNTRWSNTTMKDSVKVHQSMLVDVERRVGTKNGIKTDPGPRKELVRREEKRSC